MQRDGGSDEGDVAKVAAPNVEQEQSRGERDCVIAIFRYRPRRQSRVRSRGTAGLRLDEPTNDDGSVVHTHCRGEPGDGEEDTNLAAYLGTGEEAV